MWTAVSGASAQSQAVDMVANNLANADTIGFKKDAPAFKEYLAQVEREPGTVDIPRGPIKDKDLHPLDGRDQSFVVVSGTHTNFRQGPLRVTNSPLDLALDGPGFVEVSSPNGSRFTRAGSFKIAADGRLVTNEGHPVLAAQPGGLAAAAPAGAGNDAARFINLRDRGTNISITDAGEIFAGDELVARLSVVEFQDPGKVRKVGGSLFENKDPANAVAASRTIVRQGVLEGSNVNPIEEMTNLIKANRQFEADLKSLKTYGDLMSREANDIGKL
jgi:flagellar basal-body rod protein FlgG